jgi:hypothetical protein
MLSKGDVLQNKLHPREYDGVVGSRVKCALEVGPPRMKQPMGRFQ